MTPPDPDSKKNKSTARLLWACFCLFVIYGTTIPFSFSLGPGGLEALLFKVQWHPLGGRNGDISTPDLVQNVLLFIPFGFLGYIALVNKRSRLKRIILVLMGASLSAFVEILQLFAPTRWTAVSDVVFNTVGTAIGVYLGVRLKKAVMGIKDHPELRRWFEAPSAFPALVFLVLATAGSWEPFDFALDVSGMIGKAKQALYYPFDFTAPNDELAAFIRFLLASLFACRLAAEAGLRRPVLLAGLAYAVAALGLEGTQLIIASRSPAFQDALVSLLGVFAGAVAYRLPAFHRHPWIWGAVGALAITGSAALEGLYPFSFAPYHGGFNWMPFLSEYVKTTLQALGNVVETALTFFPLGFLLGYFFPGSHRAAWASLALTAVAAFAVEIAQGYVPGRWSDITDVLGAMAGCLAGILVLRRGWTAYREYTAPASRS